MSLFRLINSTLDFRDYSTLEEHNFLHFGHAIDFGQFPNDVAMFREKITVLQSRQVIFKSLHELHVL